MQLCEYCIKNVLQSKEAWDYYNCDECLRDETVAQYDTTGKAEKTVPEVQEEKEACLLCSTLIEDVRKLAPELCQSKEPIYRWNIRTISRIRESLEAVVLTFRPLPKIGVGDKKEENSPLPERTFYLFPEDEASPLPTREQLGLFTDPAKSGGRQIKSWIETCNTTHSNCMKRRKAMSPSSRFTPTRLLDISGPPGSPMKIIETSKTPVRGPYVTLSHCWGREKFVELTTSTYKQFVEGEGVKWQFMTQNFHDAIEVARFLDIEYIWIDSLCIIQGPDGDFPAEAGKMHQVYRNSYCNLAAVDSHNKDGGLFRKRDPRDVAPVRYVPDNASALFGRRTWYAFPGNLWESDLLQTKLYVRGWVFQERMLSPRMLHFAEKQIFWDCPSMSACESLPSGLPPPMDNAARPDRHWRGRLQEPEDSTQLAGASDDSMEDFWKTAVDKYTTCVLTKGQDKLIAMWGIAKLVRDALGVEYGAGLWESNLEDQLTWRVAECKLDDRPSESNDEFVRRDIPSWSWASMDGKIVIPDILTTELHYTVKDHFGNALAFDLVGVRKEAKRVLADVADVPSPTVRANSDSVVEMQKRYKESNLLEDSSNKSNDVVTVDRDKEPRFYSTSIPIDGHIGHGTLGQPDSKKSWTLKIEGATELEIQAFPDTVPKPYNLSTLFVVLSAKQQIRTEDTNILNRNHNTRPNLRLNTNIQEPAQQFDITGAGILIKDVGNNHFHRTGAFTFRNISEKSFKELQSADTRKFWLD